MSTRIYVVRDMVTEDDAEACRLVEAATPAQAVRFVAASRYAVEVATAKTVATLMKDGVAVERVKPEQTEIPA